MLCLNQLPLAMPPVQLLLRLPCNVPYSVSSMPSAMDLSMSSSSQVLVPRALAQFPFLDVGNGTGLQLPSPKRAMVVNLQPVPQGV